MTFSGFVVPQDHDAPSPKFMKTSERLEAPTTNAKETIEKVKVIPNYFRTPTGGSSTTCLMIGKRITKHSFERMSVAFGKGPQQWFTARFEHEKNHGAGQDRKTCSSLSGP